MIHSTICWRGGAGWLRQALWRHASIADPSANRLPNLKMPVLEVRVELVDADARGTQIGVVASHAILREERLHDLIERRFERLLGATRRLAQKETRGQRNSEEGKQSEDAYRVRIEANDV